MKNTADDRRSISQIPTDAWAAAAAYIKKHRGIANAYPAAEADPDIDPDVRLAIRALTANAMKQSTMPTPRRPFDLGDAIRRRTLQRLAEGRGPL